MSSEIIFISDSLVRDMISMKEVMEVVEEDFRRQEDPNNTVLGRPMAYATDDRQLGFRWRLKTAIIRPLPVAGVRVTGYRIDENGSGSGGEPEATRLIVLSDPASTSPLAIVDEHSTFSMRTSAAVVVAAKYLARSDSKIVGIIGVGNIGRTALLGLNEIFPIESVRVTSRRKASREAFAQSMQREVGVPVEARETYEEVCRDADILICGTPSLEPFVRFEWLKEGVFVGALGHDELMYDVYAKCDRFFVDYNPTVEAHPQHIKNAIESGAVSDDSITGQIWEVISGRVEARKNNSERIVVSTVGLTSQDISVAYRLYQQAKANGQGIRLPM